MIAVTNASLKWRIASWKRVAPTTLGGVVLLALPILFLLPLELTLLFPNRRAGTQAIMWLGAFGLVGVFGRDVGKPAPSWSWLFQKGVSLTDHALATWLADLALGAAFITWWAAAWGPLMATSFADVLAVWAGAILTFIIGLSLVFLMNAVLGRGSVELWMGFAFVALLDRLLDALPIVVRVPIRLILPPLAAAREVAGALRTLIWGSALGNLFHPLLYVAVCLGLGTYVLSRWKPRRSDYA